MFIAIVPAYNEEQTVGSVVRSLFDHVDETVVIDDGSTDGTYEQAREAGATVLRHELNRGQGAALETGHEYARQCGAEYVLHFDADGQFEASDIRPAFAKLKSTAADVLLGSRFLDSKKNIPWFKRAVVLSLAKLFHLVFYGIRLTDAHNGFRILNRRALESIRLTHDRMAHASELPVQAGRAGLQTIEFPVRVVYREYGQSASSGLDIIFDLLTNRFVK